MGSYMSVQYSARVHTVLVVSHERLSPFFIYSVLYFLFMCTIWIKIWQQLWGCSLMLSIRSDQIPTVPKKQISRLVSPNMNFDWSTFIMMLQRNIKNWPTYSGGLLIYKMCWKIIFLEHYTRSNISTPMLHFHWLASPCLKGQFTHLTTHK